MAEQYFASERIIPVTQFGLSLAVLSRLAYLGAVFDQTVAAGPGSTHATIQYQWLDESPLGRAKANCTLAKPPDAEEFGRIYRAALELNVGQFANQYPELGPYDDLDNWGSL